MLEDEAVISFLLDRQKISLKEIIEGSIEIKNASRRNRNVKVLNAQGTSYLLKQGLEDSNRQTLKRESEIYQFFDTNPLMNNFRELTPKYHYYNSIENILIIELLKDAKNLKQHHLTSGNFASYLARDLGKALGLLHYSTQSDIIRTEISHKFPEVLPFIFHVHRPYLNQYHHLSNANIQLVKIIQKSAEYYSNLEDMKAEWCAECLTHGDVRWENCLVCPDEGSKKKFSIKLIDWEYASLGDPAWDIGSVFNEYLKTWLMSIPVLAENITQAYVDLAQYPLERMQPAFGAFWDSYKQHAQIQDSEVNTKLNKSIKYAGARMLQSTYESLQSSHQISNQEIYSLQLSLNIIESPEEALRVLFKMPG